MTPYSTTPRYLFRRYEILKNIKQAKNFLEIGAGNFQLSKELLNHFEQGTALDFHSHVDTIYAELSTAYQNRLQLIKNNFLETDFDSKYDCIIACEVMEHIVEDQQFLDKINNLLKDNGQIIISVPAKMRYWSIDDQLVGHIKRYEKHELEQLFANFKNVKIIAYGYPFVNILRFLRVFLAKKQYEYKKDLSQQQLTQASGMNRLPSLLNYMSQAKFFLPLNWIASLFNNLDISEAYLIVAHKK